MLSFFKYAPTKTLAKLANNAAKRWKSTGDVVDLSNVNRQRKLMALLPCIEVWGIGSRISKKLEAMGIKTALQLADADIRFIRKHFSVVMERTVRELRGEHQFCRYVPAFVKTSPFALDEPYYGKHAGTKLLTPTQDTRNIVAAACAALMRSGKMLTGTRKAGFS